MYLPRSLDVYEEILLDIECKAVQGAISIYNNKNVAKWLGL